MKVKKVLDYRADDTRALIETIENDVGLHDYGIPRQAWLRGVKFMRHFGADRALEIIDTRALLAAERRDFDTARRWRDLIVAIHAVQEDEKLPGQNTH